MDKLVLSTYEDASGWCVKQKGKFVPSKLPCRYPSAGKLVRVAPLDNWSIQLSAINSSVFQTTGQDPFGGSWPGVGWVVASWEQPSLKL